MAIIGGVAAVNPPLVVGGVAHVGANPSVTIGGVALVGLANDVTIGGKVPIAPPDGLQGRAVVPVAPQRHFDWVLALLVWIGTWGQEYFQNQTYMKTQETHDAWKQRVRANRAVAWLELRNAWSARKQPVRPMNSEEKLHAHNFVRILRDQCELKRLKGIYHRNKKGKDINPPLWDWLLKNWYIPMFYPPSTLTDPITLNYYPPLIV